ncbi:hypothetical protein C2E31_17520 [Rhodopirellula baltica]|nr:hypothetical protein C2E31_17520 [Rhodopirellula baltica]
MWLQWKKMAAFEGRAGHQFDRVIAVSQSDKAIYQEQYGWNHVDVIDTSVDTEYFRPQDVAPTPERLVFIGSMDWLPNIDGMTWFVSEVFPKLRKRAPNVTLQIVGRNPTDAVQKLAATDGVEVTGSVDDTRPYLASSTAVIVPLRIGGGTRLKIPEAMSMKKPIISTTIGAEGLPVAHDEHLLIADRAESFVDQTVRLFDDPSLAHRLAESAYDLVQERFSSEAVARQFEAICQRTIESK